MHEVKALVNIVKFQFVSDHRIDFYFSIHVPINDFWDIRPALHAAKGRAFPDSPYDQLERSRADFFAGFSNTDDNGHTPSTMTGF